MNYEYDYEEYFLREMKHIEEQELYDSYMADVLYEEEMIERKEKMERKIIDLKDITFEEVEKLVNYVWKGKYLIPTEMIEGE